MTTMNLRKTLAASLILMSTLTYSATFVGNLSGNQNNSLLKTKTRNALKVKMPNNFKYALDEVVLSRPNYFYRFEGELQGEILIAKQTPTIVAGPDNMTGKLTKNGNQYFIDGNPAVFGRTKSIYKNEFDSESKKSFLGKKVNVHGSWIVSEGQRVFQINALIPSDLFSATYPGSYPSNENFRKSRIDYVLNTMPTNAASQSKKPFRGILRRTKDSVVKSGDPVLIITLSGRQGDAANTVGGHFAIGMGELDDNLEVQGELFNFYFEGPKEVPAGNTEMTSYFGHLIQGQNNYRPTYTVLVYGKTKAELKSVRDDLEKDLHRVRTEKGLGITPMYNCSTSAFRSLRPINITGDHEYRGFRLKDLFKPKKKPSLASGQVAQLVYGLRSDYATFIPRITFESLIKSVVKRGSQMNIHRMDYVYLPQVTSKRARGGMSVKGLSQTLLFYAVDALRANKVKKFESAVLTLDNPNASKRQKEKAQKTIDRFKSDAQFQQTLDKLTNIFF